MQIERRKDYLQMHVEYLSLFISDIYRTHIEAIPSGTPVITLTLEYFQRQYKWVNGLGVMYYRILLTANKIKTLSPVRLEIVLKNFCATMLNGYTRNGFKNYMTCTNLFTIVVNWRGIG